MRAAVITGVGAVEIAEVPDPSPDRREVVADVAACGLCGTDLHILQGEFAPSLPLVPGHEFAGEVVAVGSAVTEVALGDRAGVDPSLHCFACHGLMMLELAKRTGVASVDVVDINAERLGTARLLGCDGTAASAAEIERGPRSSR